ncbi:hypothetical protein CLOP_g14746 [Closterium sp. NIES-67]|nr:hypothetical protein CLOP_g14746 [Closterium sp. NIES-67]
MCISSPRAARLQQRNSRHCSQITLSDYTKFRVPSSQTVILVSLLSFRTRHFPSLGLAKLCHQLITQSQMGKWSVSTRRANPLQHYYTATSWDKELSTAEFAYNNTQH